MKKIINFILFLLIVTSLSFAKDAKTHVYEIDNNGTVKTYKTSCKTVKELLSDLKIKVDDDDIVIPDLDTELKSEGKISIIKVDVKVIEKEVEAPFKTIKKKNKELTHKQSKILIQGVNGKNKVKCKEYYAGDKLIKEEVIHVETIVKPIDQVFEEGTKDVFTNDRGDFTARKAIKMVATAYEAGPRSTGKRPGDKGYGITASGARAKKGTVAVDPRVIPLGTKLYVKSLTPGVPDYGFAIAQDTGGAIKGNKIDLFMDTVWECLQFGRRPVMVYILK
ncbi:MAG: 3D domain-containing protein [Eubacteriales bacterium]|uniref:G5 and 3D domain-containing protein n=1 Tax=Fenollaria sp. TaxID=1965292 RepID=UPI002A7531B7|nr:3D domain-containing protein [Fenollaria sp.]MDD7339467.1 3D domain-containing protein [Eubacteriales bacterium]MDY3105300.1 3D domain-containing protein [Fenollaria sp.]